jgi:hypothetical protein
VDAGAVEATDLQLNSRTSTKEFIAFRAKRDNSPAAPVLTLPSLQVNILGGHLPEPESNGIASLRISLKVL